MTTTTRSAKVKTIGYWATTSLLALGMLSGGIAQLLQLKGNVDGFIHLGYPRYAMTILGTWKILGVIVLLIPGFQLLKEWAYAGFFFLMTGAGISHLASGDGIHGVIAQSVFVLLIGLSWMLWRARRNSNHLIPSACLEPD